MNIFEKASRKKLRFGTSIGMLSTEDLWDLPLLSASSNPCLDDIARNIYKRLKDDTENISFVRPPKEENNEDILAFEIVKYIIESKIAEREASEQKQLKAAKKQRILEIMAKKEDESLMGASLDELKSMLSEI